VVREIHLQLALREHVTLTRRHRGQPQVNKVLLAGRLTRDPEYRVLASGKHITTFALTTEEYASDGHVTADHHAVVVWDKLAAVCAQYLGKGSRVAVEGKLQTRQWDDDRGARQWRTEVNATAVELMSGRHAKDFGSDALPEVADDDL
jgi:single-strand DNA-binding protein